MAEQKNRVVAIGEVMTELARGSDGRFGMSCGGDTFNTAVYLARAGIPVAYGTDLLGALQMEQSREFMIRSEVLSPIEIIRSATTIGARIVRQEGKLGTLKAGAFADLLLIDGDPLKNLGLFQEQGKHLAAVMKGGRFNKNRLN